MKARLLAGLTCAAAVLSGGPSGIAQNRAAPIGEWRYIGGNAAHTRYSPLDQITADNFEQLQLAWIWRGDNFGDTPDGIRNHPALKGVAVPNTGQQSHPVNMATKTLLLSAPGGDQAVLFALDKKTGTRLGTVKLPAPGQYGMMTYLHEGRQYIVVQVMGRNHPGALAALSLP
jgi:quinoprotein glucose dehydrogenase